MKLLKKLYEFDAKSGSSDMRHFGNEVMKLCRSLGAKVAKDKSGNLYVTKGQSDTYPCIASHLDEVHDRRGEGFEVIEYKGIISGFSLKCRKTHGIGADDKNGIWVALRCLEQFDVLKCAFFVDEEVGCIGSGVADMTFFDDCRFVLQIDRKGNSDFINNISFTELCSEDFVKAVNPQKYGYKPTNGMMTDVMTLKRRGLKVSCCNMSCGYYCPHTAEEYTDFADLKKCLKFVKHIIRDCTAVYPHEAKKYEYSGFGTSNRGRLSCWEDYYGDFWNIKKKSSKPEPKNEVATTAEIEQQLVEQTQFIDDDCDDYEDIFKGEVSMYNLDEYMFAEIEEIIDSNPNASVSEINSIIEENYGFKLNKEDVIDLLLDANAELNAAYHKSLASSTTL